MNKWVIEKSAIARSALLALALSGCKTGGQTTATPAPPPPPTPYVSQPTIATPGDSPHYSNTDTVVISGMCMKGYRVFLSGSDDREALCENSTYEFTINKTSDGFYPFVIMQTSPENHNSSPATFIWVRKTSVAPPAVLSPVGSPFLSSQNQVTITGSCETGAIVSLSGDGVGSSPCVSSTYSIPLAKAADGNYTINVSQTDKAGNTASAPFVWHKQVLMASPANPSLVVNTSQNLTITGGSGVYSIAIQTNNSGGSFNSVTNSYTTGTIAGVQDTLFVTDSLGASSSVVISTVPGLPDRLEFATPTSGNSQIGFAGQVLIEPLKVKVVDRYGNGVGAVPLLFRAVLGDGQLQGPTQVTSDSAGFAQVQLRLGYRALVNTVVVSRLSSPLPDVEGVGTSTLTFVETLLNTTTGKLGPTFAVSANPGTTVIADFDNDGYRDVATLNMGDTSIGILLGKGNGLLATQVKLRPICSGANSFIANDVNGDSRLDLIISCSGSDLISIRLGNGDGTFQGPLNISTALGENVPMASASADFNKDGFQDLATVSLGGAVVGVRFGAGDGTFGASTPTTVGLGVSNVLTADFNKDTWPDLVVINSADNTIGVLINDGTGAFPTHVDYMAGLVPISMTVGDFNADSWPDIAVLNQDDTSVSIFINDRAGAFNPNGSVVVGANPTWITATDLSGDSSIDLLVSSGAENSIYTLMNQGNGTFILGPALQTVSNPVYVVASDLNGDMEPDIVVTGNTDSLLHVLPGRGGGIFGYISSLGSEPSSAVAADFNNDGKLDAAVTNMNSSNVMIMLGMGNGLFGPAATLSTGAGPSAIAVGDFNRDGRVDMAITSRLSNSVRVFIGLGDGTFDTPTDYGTGAGPEALAIADLNADGFLDIAVANGNANTTSVFLGVGDGTFQPGVAHQSGSASYHVLATDLNGDQRLDLVTVSQSGNAVNVLIGNGDGTYQTRVPYLVGGNPGSAVAGDFNNDGKVDVAVTSGTDASIAVLLGNGDGSLRSPVSYPCGATPKSLLMTDVNGDGVIDLAVANGAGQTFTVLNGLGNGTFGTAVERSVFGTVTGLGLGDFNADKAIDFMVLDATKSQLQIWPGF